jgi:hypothetical protein
MANQLYTKAKEALLNGDIDLDTNTIKAILVDGADYNPVLATDNALDDIPEAARVAISPALTGVSIANGVFNAGPVTLPAVTGDQFEYIVVYKVGATEALSPLILLIDTCTGFPCTPTGADIIVSWDTGENKIFRLS